MWRTEKRQTRGSQESLLELSAMVSEKYIGQIVFCSKICENNVKQDEISYNNVSKFNQNHID